MGLQITSNFAWKAATIFLILAIGGLVRYIIANGRPKNFPPGPPTLPIIGNLHQLPLTKAFLKFHEWSNQYGSIVGVKFGPQNVVILNSYRHVRDLMDKRGALYSSRPESYLGNEILCPNETHILLVPYGDGWRKLRKAIQALLNATAVDKVLPIQAAEASQTLFQLLQSPEECFHHIRRYSTAVILASVFGQRGSTYESAKVQALYHAQDQFTAILAPGATPPVDAFPFLKLLPDFLSPWKAKAQAIRQEQRSLYFNLFNQTKEQLRNGIQRNCFMERLINDKEKSELTEEQIAYTGGILMEAGSDTTSSTLLSFIMAMIENPQVLKKAQAEVDQICSTERSPTSVDIDKLSYLRAIMTETLRWRPVAPGGIPHMLIQDDYYEGYFLPKGTILFANTWSIHLDDTEYEQPEKFIPERFLDAKFGTRPDAAGTGDDSQRRITYSFGAGRRVCSGQRLAENSLMVNMAKMAWAFDISVDPSSPIDSSVETGYSDGFVFSPTRFSANFTARSEKHKEVILREYENAKTIFAVYDDS